AGYAGEQGRGGKGASEAGAVGVGRKGLAGEAGAQSLVRSGADVRNEQSSRVSERNCFFVCGALARRKQNLGQYSPSPSGT
ncbi:MAG: hypothetical protein AAF471_08135, partial [Myxococcota bacterium]